ncbi:MAG: PhoX family phosphatase [Nitrosospira sp.]|nr:PhoX family phosphatase [Nitrosospira sp.]
MSSTLHPDGKTAPSYACSNASGNPSLDNLIDARKLSRRAFLRGSLGITAVATLGGSLFESLVNYSHAGSAPLGGIGFSSVPPNFYHLAADDSVTVPHGYTARVLVAWGDSLTRGPHWDPAGAMTEAMQLRTFGAHIDGMHLFPFPATGAAGIANTRGLLVTNHEYVDPPLVNNIAPASGYTTTPLTLGMVRAQQAAHGISVVEVWKKNDSWEVKRPSAFNRRITGNSPCKLSGPAAGHDLMKTAADPSGTTVLGTLNNCAHGYTPWGTYLTCEENWNGYFSNETGDVVGVPDMDQKLNIISGQTRYGVVKGGFGYRWHEIDQRFRADLNPNEPHRFGWVVEIDPWKPYSTPIKRTALGRVKHEGAWCVVGSDNTVVVYMGDDERNEYVYKFVCAHKYNPGNRAANRDLLDSGTLFVARFDASGGGVWLPLAWGQNGLLPENGFADQAEVLVKTRQAADRVGATMMDRPEWIAAHPATGEVYMTLTNNNRRGSTPPSSNNADGSTNAGSARPLADAANPRPDNRYGHIIRWRENMGKVDATDFDWDIFVECGDKLDPQPHHRGNINGDDYGAPDGLWFDQDGRLWIQTDQMGNATGDWANIGGNVMLCANPSTGETRRFLTAPKNCEVTGVINTPDGKTMFVGIQHPGEDWETHYTQNSTWPDSGINGPTTTSGTGSSLKPRSAVVVITKDDGGVIGS